MAADLSSKIQQVSLRPAHSGRPILCDRTQLAMSIEKRLSPVHRQA